MCFWSASAEIRTSFGWSTSGWRGYPDRARSPRWASRSARWLTWRPSRLPFEGSEFDTLAQHVVAPPRPPGELVRGLDPRVEAIILTAMRKLPRNRYPTMSDLMEDLERVLGQRQGALAAGELWEPDHYLPRSAYAKSVAAALYRKLGLEPPSWGD
jgi:hypothetical protein